MMNISHVLETAWNEVIEQVEGHVQFVDNHVHALTSFKRAELILIPLTTNFRLMEESEQRLIAAKGRRITIPDLAYEYGDVKYECIFDKTTLVQKGSRFGEKEKDTTEAEEGFYVPFFHVHSTPKSKESTANMVLTKLRVRTWLRDGSNPCNGSNRIIGVPCYVNFKAVSEGTKLVPFDDVLGKPPANVANVVPVVAPTEGAASASGAAAPKVGAKRLSEGRGIATGKRGRGRGK